MAQGQGLANGNVEVDPFGRDCGAAKSDYRGDGSQYRPGDEIRCGGDREAEKGTTAQATEAIRVALRTT